MQLRLVVFILYLQKARLFAVKTFVMLHVPSSTGSTPPLSGSRVIPSCSPHVVCYLLCRSALSLLIKADSSSLPNSRLKSCSALLRLTTAPVPDPNCSGCLSPETSDPPPLLNRPPPLALTLFLSPLLSGLSLPESRNLSHRQQNTFCRDLGCRGMNGVSGMGGEWAKPGKIFGPR